MKKEEGTQREQRGHLSVLKSSARLSNTLHRTCGGFYSLLSPEKGALQRAGHFEETTDCVSSSALYRSFHCHTPPQVSVSRRRKI